MRPIDPSGLTITPPASFGPAPDLRWIDISQLVVDPAYQRDLNKHSARHIGQIAEKFDWRLFSAVIVSPIAGGRFAIVDGQHRTTAAAACGIDSVPCQIIQADAGMQARAFEAINGKVIAVSTLQRYRAAIAGGDPEALRIKALTERGGVKMLTSNYGLNCQPGDTMAYNAVRRICSHLPDDGAAFLFALARAMVKRPRVYIRAEMLLALLAVFTEDHPEWMGDLNIAVILARLDQEHAYEQARKFAGETKGVKITDCLAGDIIETVQEGLATKAA